MNYRMEEKEGFTIVGIKERLSDFYSDVSKSITNMREEIGESVHTQLEKLSNVKPFGRYSALFNVSPPVKMRQL